MDSLKKKAQKGSTFQPLVIIKTDSPLFSLPKPWAFAKNNLALSCPNEANTILDLADL